MTDLISWGIWTIFPTQKPQLFFFFTFTDRKALYHTLNQPLQAPLRCHQPQQIYIAKMAQTEIPRTGSPCPCSPICPSGCTVWSFLPDQLLSPVRHNIHHGYGSVDSPARNTRSSPKWVAIADANFTRGSDMSPEVQYNLCNLCYILGMPDPRPDIRCVQYLPKSTL